MKKGYFEIKKKVDDGHIFSVQGIDGIDYYTAGVLYAAIEQTIKRALIDLPDASLEEIANAVMVGVRMFANSLRRDNVEHYAQQFRSSE